MTQQRINIGKIDTSYVGDWDAQRTYNVFDTVTYNGAVYMAYQNSTGEQPDVLTSYYTTYQVNPKWTTQISFLRPRATDDDILQFLQLVSKNNKLKYVSTYSADKTRTDFFNGRFFCDVVDFTKGY